MSSVNPKDTWDQIWGTKETACRPAAAAALVDSPAPPDHVAFCRANHNAQTGTRPPAGPRIQRVESDAPPSAALQKHRLTIVIPRPAGRKNKHLARRHRRSEPRQTSGSRTKFFRYAVRGTRQASRKNTAGYPAVSRVISRKLPRDIPQSPAGYPANSRGISRKIPNPDDAYPAICTVLEILKRCGTTSLYPILKQRRLRWLGHVSRMDHSRLPHQVLCGQLADGKRDRGRPKLRFIDVCKRDLKLFHIGANWEHLAQNRTAWRYALRQGAKKLEDDLVQNETTRRQKRHHPSATPAFTCTTCGKLCRSKAGLAAHGRSHRR
ncbi:hypothetical protein Bbelb_041550 [Branchiostoma belcheri]|nr:hypothetical protein Bbelb_041550 [Branchiostoma belcheri]